MEKLVEHGFNGKEDMLRKESMGTWTHTGRIGYISSRVKGRREWPG